MHTWGTVRRWGWIPAIKNLTPPSYLVASQWQQDKPNALPNSSIFTITHAIPSVNKHPSIATQLYSDCTLNPYCFLCLTCGLLQHYPIPNMCTTHILQGLLLVVLSRHKTTNWKKAVVYQQCFICYSMAGIPSPDLLTPTAASLPITETPKNSLPHFLMT